MLREIYLLPFAQVKALGCSGFALLWDDIDSNLSPGDRDAFSSLAEAQVKVRFYDK